MSKITCSLQFLASVIRIHLFLIEPDLKVLLSYTIFFADWNTYFSLFTFAFVMIPDMFGQRS
jgi:hypothetical protein